MERPDAFRAEEAKNAVPGFSDNVGEQIQRDIKGYGEVLTGHVKKVGSFFGALGSAINTVVNLDTAKPDDAAKIFSPEGLVGKAMTGLGVGGFQLGLGLPVRLFANAKVNGIPGVKHAITAADRLTGRVPGRLLRRTPVLGFVASKANRLIQGEAHTYNRMAQYNTYEQTSEGKHAVAVETLKGAAEQARTKYANPKATREERAAAMKEFTAKVDDTFYDEPTMGGRILRTARLTKRGRVEARLRNYIKTNIGDTPEKKNRQQLRANRILGGINAKINKLNAIQENRKSIAFFPTTDDMKIMFDNKHMTPAEIRFKKQEDSVKKSISKVQSEYNEFLSKEKTSTSPDVMFKSKKAEYKSKLAQERYKLKNLYMMRQNRSL